MPYLAEFVPELDFKLGELCRWLLPGDILHFLSTPNRFDLKPNFFKFFDKNQEKLLQILNNLINFEVRQLDGGEILISLREAGLDTIAFEISSERDIDIPEIDTSLLSHLFKSMQGTGTRFYK